MEDLEGVLEVEALSGPMVQLLGYRIGVADASGVDQVGAFGQVLAKQAVGVFVGSPLPGVVGMGEEDGQVQFLLQFDGTGEFAAIVQRQAAAFVSRQSADGSAGDC